MATKDMIQKLKTAPKSNGGSGNKIREGRYRLVVNKIQFEEKFTGDTFISEFRVKGAEPMPGATEDDDKTPVVPNPIGASCSLVIQPFLDPKLKDQRAGDIRVFLEELDGGEHTDEQYSALFDSATNDKSKDAEGSDLEVNPCRGFEIDCEAVARAKRIQSGPNKGKKFILLKWRHVDCTPEEVSQNIAWLDGKTAQSAA